MNEKNNDTAQEIFLEAYKGSVVVWTFVTILLWVVFAITFFLALLGYVAWSSPIAPLVLAALASAANPTNRLMRASQEAARNQKG